MARAIRRFLTVFNSRRLAAAGGCAQIGWSFPGSCARRLAGDVSRSTPPLLARFTLEFFQHRLSTDQVIVEDLPRH
jgi:hypothetical protein